MVAEKPKHEASVTAEEGDEVVEFTFDWEQGWESIARVSLAGCVGALVGLSKDQKQHMLEQHQAAALNRKLKLEQEAARNEKNKQHPRKAPQFAPRAVMFRKTYRYLGMWSVSCALFVTIMESFRRSSPTSLVLDYYNDDLAGEEYDAKTRDGDTSATTFPV